jgi:hypothetical protein
VNAAFLSGNDAKLREQESRSNNGMPGEPQLFLCGEDAQAGQGFFFRRFLDENGLGEIHLARNGEHFVVGKLIAIGKNGERIALESRTGKNVECVEAMFHGGK